MKTGAVLVAGWILLSASACRGEEITRTHHIKKRLKEWVGNWVLKRWPEVTKEELHGIKVKY